MRNRRLTVGAVVVLVFVAAMATTTTASPGDPLILGDLANDAANTVTGLQARTGSQVLRVTQNANGEALRGQSRNGIGVAGRTISPDSYGIRAWSSATADGVGAALLAEGDMNDGVVASTNSTENLSAAVKGTTTGFGYAGYFDGGASGTGVYAESTADLNMAVTAISSGIDALGVYGLAEGPFSSGIYGINIDDATSYAGFFAGPTYVMGDLTVTGSCTGCTAIVHAVNGSDVALGRGVALTVLGVGEPVIGATPLLIVGPASPGDFVIGVVDRALRIEPQRAPGGERAKGGQAIRITTLDRGAEPSEHLGVVVGGVTYALVEGPVVPGDELSVVSPAGGLGAPSVDASASIGFALEHLDNGRSLIAVLVSLR